jgi:hypothetical protein
MTWEPGFASEVKLGLGCCGAYHAFVYRGRSVDILFDCTTITAAASHRKRFRVQYPKRIDFDEMLDDIEKIVGEV